MARQSVLAGTKAPSRSNSSARADHLARSSLSVMVELLGWRRAEFTQGAEAPRSSHALSSGAAAEPYHQITPTNHVHQRRWVVDAGDGGLGDRQPSCDRCSDHQGFPAFPPV